MKNSILISLFILAFGVPGQAQEENKVTLTIEVEGSIPAEGSLILSVYASEGDWLQQPHAVVTKDLTTDYSLTFVMEDLPAGTYAFSVYHDANNNNTLDMGNMGPTESYGFSNGARGQYGPAPFSEAKMSFWKDTTTKVKIN